MNVNKILQELNKMKSIARKNLEKVEKSGDSGTKLWLLGELSALNELLVFIDREGEERLFCHSCNRGMGLVEPIKNKKELNND